MDLDACLAELPPGYRVLHGSRGVLAVREEDAGSLEAAGFGPDGQRGGALAPSDLAGRRPLGSIRPAGGRDEEWVVRTYHHGGLLRWLSGARFADPTRPFRELVLASGLEACGVRTPRVIAARARRARGGLWELALVTRRVPEALDVSHALQRLLPPGGDPVRQRATRALVVALGTLVGDLHRLGFHHADLTPRNLLVEEGLFVGEEPRLWVLDLDRGRFGACAEEAERTANLVRFQRFFVRRPELRDGLFTRANLARFLLAYRAARGAERAGWKEEWERIGRTLGRSLGRHRMGWRLEEVFGGGRATPDGSSAARGIPPD